MTMQVPVRLSDIRCISVIRDLWSIRFFGPLYALCPIFAHRGDL